MSGEHQQDFLRATMSGLDLVHNLARRLSDSAQDAEDLVQETYLSAYRAWSAGSRPRELNAWLSTICLNLARSRYRRSRRRVDEVLVPDVSLRAERGETPDVDAVDRLALERAIAQLPDAFRECVVLVDLAGMRTAEAASALGIPRGTVLSRLHRARRALAVLLKEEWEVRS
jgi:RNA polymerase sigma-70 factor (ECF subfamily)